MLFCVFTDKDDIRERKHPATRTPRSFRRILDRYSKFPRAAIKLEPLEDWGGVFKIDICGYIIVATKHLILLLLSPRHAVLHLT